MKLDKKVESVEEDEFCAKYHAQHLCIKESSFQSGRVKIKI